MARLTLDATALQRNLARVDAMVASHGASWTLVTKVLSGWREALEALVRFGVRSVADSRLENITALKAAGYPGEIWYLRPPCLSDLEEVVRTAACSMQSDLSVLETIDREAGRQGRIHHAVVMVELGDLREGVLPGALSAFFGRAAALDHIRIAGIGCNLGCLSGTIPTIDQFSQLELYRELMSLKFKIDLPLLSAGTSAVLPVLLAGNLPASVNHFRIGEAVFLGNDLLNGGIMAGLQDDVVWVEAEVVELREKSSLPYGEVQNIGPFEHMAGGGDGRARGVRAVVSIGQLDTLVGGLVPVDPRHRVVGASSDLAVIAVDEGGGNVAVGDWIRFNASYGALARLTSSPYVARSVVDPGGVLAELDRGDRHAVPIPPVFG